MCWKVWTIASLAAIAGCSFESSEGGTASAGLGQNSDASSDASDSSQTTDDETTGPSGTSTSTTSDPTGASDPTGDSNPTTDPTTTGPTTTTTAETSDSDSTSESTSGPTIQFDGEGFGPLDYQTPASRDFTITNVGDEAATTFALTTSGPFDIESTDCPGSLEPQESCAARLRHGADVLGPFSGDLEVTYDGGAEDQPLAADVIGSTGNLVVDGGFETCPDGPWQDVGAGEWLCNANWVPAHGGSGFLSGDTGPNNQLYDYRLDVDVSAYSDAIATGNMSFEFRGWGRSAEENNVPYRMRVRYRNPGGQTVAAFNTNAQTSTSWTEHVDTRQAPADTDELRIDLYCQKSGGDRCDAYYDDIVLIGTYEGS